MEAQKILNNYRQELNYAEIQDAVNKIVETVNDVSKQEIEQIFTFIDLTFLNITDNSDFIATMTKRVNHVKPVLGLENVACMMVYPRFVPVIKNNLIDEDVKIGCVVGNFPSSQTFLDVKVFETEKSIKEGADEVDMVISVGEFLAGNYDLVFNEIKQLRQAAGDKLLKVILETGTLNDFAKIYEASILAMEAGADFIKTSTGKEKVGATFEAVYVMAMAAKDHFDKTGRKVGIKPAGGVSDVLKAKKFIEIVRNVLGNEWINKDLFRIGSSSLANKIILQLGLYEGNYFSAQKGY